MKKGFKQTKEHIAKRVAKQLGQKRTKEQRKRMSLAAKRYFEKHDNHWKGKKRVDQEYLKKISEAHKGQHSSPATEFKKGRINPNKGKPNPSQGGENHYNWQGGITSKNNTIRRSIEYRLWREAVFARDNFTCQECGIRGGDLEAHHIKSFARHPELRVAVDNGLTLCKKCHNKTKKYGSKIK